MRHLLLILIVIFAAGCDSSNNYIPYHLQMIKAENHILKSEYDSAFYVYKKVLNEFPHSFYKDLHNACLCALRLSDAETARKYAEQLVLQGYDMSDFSKNAFFSLKKNVEQWAIFQNHYSNLREDYLKGQDPALRKKYRQLFEDDQKAASSYDLRIQDSVFYHNTVELSSMFRKHGFPTLDVNKDSMNFKIYIFFRHYFGLVNRVKEDPEMQKDAFYAAMDFKKLNMDSVLLEALHRGEMLPQTYANAVSYWDSSNPYGDIAVKIDFNTEKTSLYLHLKPEKVKDVNERRKKIGLFPINDLSDEMLKSVWLSQYPFKEIKEAYLNCDTCKTMLDYMNLSDKLENSVRSNFEKGIHEDFILPDLNNIKNFWISGNKPYMKNIEELPAF